MTEFQAFQIRKSFHRFGDLIPLTEEEKKGLDEAVASLEPLDPGIRVEIVKKTNDEVSGSVKAEFFYAFYSEEKPGSNQNIGYLGEQIDLYCAAHGIGSLWYGLGGSDEKDRNGLRFVILLAIGKSQDKGFRSNFEGAKRKAVEETWEGDHLEIAELARFAPSAVNSQPWRVKASGNELRVFRDPSASRIGPILVKKMILMNQVDLGIYLRCLEVVLREKGIGFRREFDPEGTQEGKLLLEAVYRLN